MNETIGVSGFEVDSLTSNLALSPYTDETVLGGTKKKY